MPKKNAMQVTYDYAIGNRFYVEMTDIYCKLYYKKQGPYRIIKVFTNGTVRFQWEEINERIL